MAVLNPNLIAIALGDAGGIGPEVTLKAVAAELTGDDTRYVLIGNGGLLVELSRKLKLNLPLAPFRADDAQARVTWCDPLTRPPGTTVMNRSAELPLGAAQTSDRAELELGAPPRLKGARREAIPGGLSPIGGEGAADYGPGCAAHARAAIAWLKHGAELCLRGEADALVTAPVNKESIIRSGLKDFVGQTELLSALAKTERTAMMLLGCDDRQRWLRVALATVHLPIARVAQSLTREKIELVIELAARACRDLGLPRARVAVCGLNPHAGEGGQIGTEEITTILPAVEAARANGVDVLGPLAADTLFHYAFRGDYDAVVAMYHDQGLVPLKMIGFETGVNWTLGLPFIRTSPDHGTAYDIAGKGIANPSSMVAAIQLAKKLARRASG
ncbi:MAG TPA: 4-hydroxythreonine-4-phosphate dehydrogenase PdxA [Verrucomicrobiae bacterium]|nr:4-hydroxythreonine-4-phosphate dehydrogenase PdxA [Verrucomicrobiae bacterium]